MVAKKKADDDIFGIDFVEPVFEKKPTIKQFQKERKDGEHTDNCFRVETIWFPGNWDNYTIETTHFRGNISPNHPLFSALDKLCPRLRERSNGIVLELKDTTSATFRFVESGEYGKWEPIGNAGVRFKPAQ